VKSQRIIETMRFLLAFWHKMKHEFGVIPSFVLEIPTVQVYQVLL
jgi:hypothetical protein